MYILPSVWTTCACRAPPAVNGTKNTHLAYWLLTPNNSRYLHICTNHSTSHSKTQRAGSKLLYVEDVCTDLGPRSVACIRKSFKILRKVAKDKT